MRRSDLTTSLGRGALWWSALGLASLALGCAGDEESDPQSGGRAEEAVVVAVLTRNPDGSSQTYLFADAKAPKGKLDLGEALELPDTLVTQTDDAIFVGDNEALTLQRYEVQSDYSLEMVGEFSLQSYGVDYINNDPLFFSDTRAFYVDAPRGQIIVFNPTTMEITGDIDAPELLRDDYTTWIGPSQRVGDRYLATILYTDENWTASAPDSTVGVVIEDDPKKPVHFLRDDRGVGAYLSFLGEDDDFYFVADGLSGNLALSKSQDVPTSRVFRVRRGEDEIDPSYMLDLGKLLDTPATFGFWPVSRTAFVVQAWASDVDPEDVLEPGEGGWGQPYYDWKYVDLETEKARPVKGLERSLANNTLRFQLDGKTYIQRLIEEGDRAELYVLGENASAKKVAETTKGDFWFLGRVTAKAD